MPILIASYTCPLYLRETCNSGCTHLFGCCHLSDHSGLNLFQRAVLSLQLKTDIRITANLIFTTNSSGWEIFHQTDKADMPILIPLYLRDTCNSGCIHLFGCCHLSDHSGLNLFQRAVLSLQLKTDIGISASLIFTTN